MRINADFSKRVVVRPSDYNWVHSPAGGVDRMMLDRIGDEVARATTLVRFAPNSYFDAHRHDGGEEYLVLDGIFSDESGDYPAGSYVRNPIGTAHKPHTAGGCTILVKLHQFEAEDQDQKVIDTATVAFRPGQIEGLSVLPLHDQPQEHVALVRWAPVTQLGRHAHWGGEEVYVIEGVFQDEYGDYPAGSWIRSPHLSEHRSQSDKGCLIYVKTGHLLPVAA